MRALMLVLAGLAILPWSAGAADGGPADGGERMIVVAVSVTLVLLNLGSATAFWYFLIRPMGRGLRRHREELETLKHGQNQFATDLANLRLSIGHPAAKIVGLEKRVASLESDLRDLDDKIDSTHETRTRSQLAAAARLSGGDSTAAGKYPELREPLRNSPAPAAWPQPPVVKTPARERLGALFVQEISASGGMDPAAIWERCLAKIRAEHPARWQPLFWDRSAPQPRFHEQPSRGFTDTAECWLVQTDAEAFLFFPALAKPHAIKDDLAGCEVISAGGALLDASRLAVYLPPVVTSAPDGWVIQTTGLVEYH